MIMVRLTTTQLNSAHSRKLASEGWTVYDITIKSGDKNFAPTWDMVKGHRRGLVSDQEYTQQYHKMMVNSYKQKTKAWENLLQTYGEKGLALACYCDPKDFCHRHLILEYLSKAAKAWGHEVKIISEPDRPKPQKQPAQGRTSSTPKIGDGVDHINIYSKGETELGRLLSNFAHTPVRIRGEQFASLEAYWYHQGIQWPARVEAENDGWKSSADPAAKDKKRLINSHGYQAKKLGKELKEKYGERKTLWFQSSFKNAMKQKVDQHPKIAKLLVESDLPFRHYYVFNGIEKDAGFEWIVEEWEDLRRGLKDKAEVPAAKAWLERHKDMFSAIPEGHLPDRAISGSTVKKAKAYAGIGSRKAPKRVLQEAKAIATLLEKKGYTLRSGGADGMDSAFESGVSNEERKEVYTVLDCEEWCLGMVSKYVPEDRPPLRRMKKYVQKLLGRNMKQVLGAKGNDPVEFVVCWTPLGVDDGGTGYAVRCAWDHSIPVYNLKNEEDRKKLYEEVLGEEK